MNQLMDNYSKQPIHSRYIKFSQIQTQAKIEINRLEKIKDKLTKERYESILLEQGAVLIKIDPKLDILRKNIKDLLDKKKKEIKPIEDEIGKIENKINESIILYKSNFINKKKYKKELTPLKKEKKKLIDPIKKLNKDIYSLENALNFQINDNSSEAVVNAKSMAKDALEVEKDGQKSDVPDLEEKTKARLKTFFKKVKLKRRKPLIALLLSIITPGLGQVYNGQLKKGVIYHFGGYLLFLILSLTRLLYNFHGPNIFYSTVLLYLIFIVVDAVYIAIRRKETNLKFYNKWYIYCLIVIFAIVISVVIDENVKNVVLGGIKIGFISPISAFDFCIQVLFGMF